LQKGSVRPSLDVEHETSQGNCISMVLFVVTIIVYVLASSCMCPVSNI